MGEQWLQAFVGNARPLSSLFVIPLPVKNLGEWVKHLIHNMEYVSHCIHLSFLSNLENNDKPM